MPVAMLPALFEVNSRECDELTSIARQRIHYGGGAGGGARLKRIVSLRMPVEWIS